MSTPKTFAATASIAGAVALLAAAAMPASAQQRAPQGWFKVCSKQEDNDICNTQNIVTADSGQLLTAVNLIEIKGKINRKIFQVSVPTGRLIAPGVGLQINGGKTQKVDYAICFPDRCISEVALSDELLAAFKKGNQLTMTSVNFQNKPNPINVALTGFTQAYEGPGLQQNELEQRQKTLQEEVQKRQKEFEEKMKAEQQKAKTGN
ncbi:invasion associated locus B family protein [Phyllobacterium endophyticum]|jgi:invasion protein IalB|uniref:Invasion-associated locus B family protein n=1 Tax=Phyllobacterium endophyticum TaxID=1149773 RepID=A0A2P7AVN9_9HYPH|nr:invasion associated locus B family protein [Phyllobacterium endophyticum]MBB3234856.1 invasion protein IalB [Phyllobacterium endophyticum]PSH58282.1 invasion-associated locus B family protein [Phyllobacterium endophyticum]TXR50671.1 invasion associated locus B family protein [Phyllobacterium endophyticum]TYR38965.1 invasion associated locus B family protein [Phyllobacterium endophyticum]